MQNQSSNGRTLAPLEAPPFVFQQSTEFFVLKPLTISLLWGVWFTTRQEQGKTSRAYEERSPCFPPGLLQEQTGERKNHSTVHSAEERHMTLLSKRDKHFSLTKTTGKDWQLQLNEDYLTCRTENWCQGLWILIQVFCGVAVYLPPLSISEH